MKLILASGSPRRRELLAQAGFEFTVEAADLDETALPEEAAAQYVERLAVEKAQAVCRLHPGEDVLVLGADTAVVLADGTVLGKPSGKADAIRMLTLLSGRTHAVMTGVAAVSSKPGAKMVSDVEVTQVTVNLIPDAEMAAYVTTGEPLDKAGAYGIQGYAARWIPRVEGDYFNIVGLPLARVVRLLGEAELAEEGVSDSPAEG